ncbi:MAG: 3',5'-cyclic-nucleotide phosphodiesterase [Gemmatimonadetes bacterium]|nr:3',5'-cyclic-nucleotide phosphodiesterase [Gemmatimonadota bacterium]
MLTILHGSDLHFGRPFDEAVARVFRETIRGISPDLLVLSGDFTQRAKVREYRLAREFLDSLPDVPTVVTPGNHDVPLYRVWERVFAPLRNYRQFLSEELDTVTRVEGAVVVSLNSTAPLRAVVNGHLTDPQLLFAAEALKDARPTDLRVLVFHHHLAPAPDYESDQVLKGYQRCIRAFEKMKVDLILGGHLHRSFTANTQDVIPGKRKDGGIVIAHSGTTTSTRGRARERNKNTLNLIGISREWMEITHHLYVDGANGFVPMASHAFPRRGGALPGRAGTVAGHPADDDAVGAEERGE